MAPTSPRSSSAGGAQGVHQAADVGDGALGLRLQTLDQGSGGSRVLFYQVVGHVELERKATEHRTEAVVQVAPQATALLLPGGDQALSRALKLRREVYGVGGGSGLPGEIFEQVAVGEGECLSGSAGGQDQLAVRLPLVYERQSQRLLGGSSALGGHDESVPVLERDGGVG